MTKDKPKNTSPLPRRSKKMGEKYKERIPLVKRLLAERPWCEACPIFASHDNLVVYIRRPSVDIHELKRRSQGGSILDEKNLLAVCRECHRRIGNNPQLAFDLNLSKHEWDNDD
jgi:5-methylcytosine-specific restriction endonuclease McrA